MTKLRFEPATLVNQNHDAFLFLEPGVGFQDPACFRNDVGEFFHMELSEKAAFLFSELYFGQTTHTFNKTPPEHMGPRGHGANDPVMAATCGWTTNSFFTCILTGHTDNRALKRRQL